MNIRTCTISDICWLHSNKIEPMCYSGTESRLDPKCAVTIEDKGRILCCGGIQEVSPGVGNAWFIMVPEGKKHKKEIIKVVVEEIADALKRFHRIQCVVQKDFQEGQRFVEWLGFRREGELRCFTADKKNVYSYAIV